MFKFLNNLAYKITRENWGFPWHILLALILTQGLLKAGYKYAPYFDRLFLAALAWIFVNAIGLAYEAWQKYHYGNPRRDFWQDMLANNLGFVVGTLLSIG